MCLSCTFSSEKQPCNSMPVYKPQLSGDAFLPEAVRFFGFVCFSFPMVSPKIPSSCHSSHVLTIKLWYSSPHRAQHKIFLYTLKRIVSVTAPQNHETLILGPTVPPVGRDTPVTLQPSKFRNKSGVG